MIPPRRRMLRLAGAGTVTAPINVSALTPPCTHICTGPSAEVWWYRPCKTTHHAESSLLHILNLKDRHLDGTGTGTGAGTGPGPGAGTGAGTGYRLVPVPRYRWRCRMPVPRCRGPGTGTGTGHGIYFSSIQFDIYCSGVYSGGVYHVVKSCMSCPSPKTPNRHFAL